MIDTAYLCNLIEKCREELDREYNLAKLSFDDFAIITTQLINKIIYEENRNLLITIPDKKRRWELYVPAILITALSTFFKNYSDYDYEPKVGDVLQKGGRRYKVTEIDEDHFYHLESPELTKCKIHKSGIHEYFVTTGELTPKKVKLKFDSYKKFFDTLFRGTGKELPSKFKYKSIIVSSKEIIEEMKNITIDSKKIEKAIPFQYISKGGTKSNNLPVDPMIYIVNEYDTAMEYILKKKDEDTIIDSVVFIGATKYDSIISQISRDLRNRRFNRSIFIGKAPIDNFRNLLKWNWTVPELKKLHDLEAPPIDIIEKKNEKLTAYVEQFNELIRDVKQKFHLNLNDLCFHIKKLFSLAVPSADSRLMREFNDRQLDFEKNGAEFIRDEFLGINEDHESYYNRLRKTFLDILETIRSDKGKFEKLREQTKSKYLVVSRHLKETWLEDIENLGLKKIMPISYDDFLKLDKEEPKNVYFLSIYGFSFFKHIINSPHYITLLLFDIETKGCETFSQRYMNELEGEFKSPDRRELSGLDYPEKREQEDVGDLIERLFPLDLDEQKVDEYFKYQSPDALLQLEFEDHETREVKAHKSVLLTRVNGTKTKEIVARLKPGDEIIIYENTTKEHSYEIAVQEDKEERFAQIDNDSKLWKQALSDYSRTQCAEDLDRLYRDLSRNGLKLKDTATLKKWLDINDKDKFPAVIRNLTAIKNTIKNDKMDENFESIKNSRKKYRGIMIALGRDMSDEISDYILSGHKEKGKILSKFSDAQVESFIDANAKPKKITNINIIKDSCDENE